MITDTPSSNAELLKTNGITKLYHFTDDANIQSIIDNGGLYSWKTCEDKGITIRKPGGDDLSRSLDKYKHLENYVRLCFTKNHPMMYAAKKTGRINSPVILEIDLSIANLPTTKFSDRNATKNGAIIHSGLDGVSKIHFKTVKQPNHFDLSTEEKEFYQAEVLVLEKIPISYITNIDLYKPQPNPPKPSTVHIDSRTIHRQTISSSSSTRRSDSTESSDNQGCMTVIIIGIILLLLAIFG